MTKVIVVPKYGGLTKAAAAKALGCKQSELIDRNEAALVMDIGAFRTRALFATGKLPAVKLAQGHLKGGKWVTSKALCSAYQQSKGKRGDGMVAVVYRMPKDKAIEFAKTHEHAELRYTPKKK